MYLCKGFFFFNLSIIDILYCLCLVHLEHCKMFTSIPGLHPLEVVLVQLLSHVWFFVTPWTAVCQAPLSSAIFQSLLKLVSTELVMLSNHLILCCPLLLLPSVFPIFKVFSNELALGIRWPSYWSFSFSNSPTNEYSGLVSWQDSRESSLAPQFESNPLDARSRTLSCDNPMLWQWNVS